MSKIKNFKSFINESILRYGDINIHDMVYVNAFDRNFDDDTKYEVVYVKHNPRGGFPVAVGLFDNTNNYTEVDIKEISLDTPFSGKN